MIYINEQKLLDIRNSAENGYSVTTRSYWPYGQLTSNWEVHSKLLYVFDLMNSRFSDILRLKETLFIRVIQYI